MTQAEQAYLLQQLTYSEHDASGSRDVAVAERLTTARWPPTTPRGKTITIWPTKQTVQCSQLTSAKTNLDRAQTAYDRLANDHQAKNYLNSDWGPFQSVVKTLTDAQSAYDLAVANCNITKTSLNDSCLESAQAQVQSAKTNLDNLVSPRQEKQIQAAAQLEQARLVAGTGQAESGQCDDRCAVRRRDYGGQHCGRRHRRRPSAAMKIADISQLHVDVLVDETEIAGIQPGQPAQITLDALPGITLTGKVDAIDPAGTISQGVVNYSVRVNLDPTDAPVQAGYDGQRLDHWRTA